MVEEDIVRNSRLPVSMHSWPVKIEGWEAVGRSSREALTIGHDETRLFLKIDPSYLEGDKGTYFVRLYLRKDAHNQNSGLSRFNFHLVGSTFGASRFEDIWLSLRSGSAVSQRFDNERTPEIAALTMPCL